MVKLIDVTTLFAALLIAQTFANPSGLRCIVEPSGVNSTDDSPAIIEAFEKCGKNGNIVFKNETYFVNSVLKFEGLRNVKIDVYGTLLWSTDIEYWLNNSLDVGYQNQSTAFILGGDGIVLDGHGTGTFDGNGDYWYQWIREQENTSNYPGRPHQITFQGFNNSIVRGMTFLRSQMWTMSIIHSHFAEFSDILVNNTGNVYDSSNTDGADTIYSSHIVFDRWTVYNGDDSISLKANSTDITVKNSVFHDGLGVALGSIGQYYGAVESIERLHVENCSFVDCLHAAYVKTWTGDQNGYPPNGGGGGFGFTKGIVFKDLRSVGMRGSAFAISQCTRFIGAPGDGNCTNSEFHVSEITVKNLTGTTKSRNVASLQCSAVRPCDRISLLDIDLAYDNGTSSEGYLCGNVDQPKGFTCTGAACEGGSSTGECSN